MDEVRDLDLSGKDNKKSKGNGKNKSRSRFPAGMSIACSGRALCAPRGFVAASDGRGVGCG